MKGFVLVSVCFLLALVGLGSAITCYSCNDYSATCTATNTCPNDDACVAVYERGGKTYRSCIKYSECDFSNLAIKFGVNKFTYNCCTNNLCNSAPATTVKSSVLGSLLFLSVLWWCVV